ncbi:uncharacterized protein LOC142325147 isoform X10 [Lycorma delicatula]|uniref:uncharacterized protein LOC142325147 isoform X10 n=1 Tax=Lycorma delicatula TaxID=130591 RepID=UPI003F513290
MELPPGQSYGYQRECMTFNYPVKPDPSEKCSEIDENKRKEHTSEDGEVMYVKVDPKCFDGTDDGGVSANHQTTIKHETEPEKVNEGLIPQELPTGSCKSPTHSQHPPPQPRPPSSMEPSQSNVAVDKDSDRKLIPQVLIQETEWCQKIDADEIAHFLDVDIAMKESEMKYNTALGTIDQKVLSCLRQKTSPACKENNYSTGEPRRLYTQHAYVQTTNSEKPFTCSVCGKYFNQASHLQQHMRTHTGERPFTCSLCSGTFTRMSDLKRHMRTHTGEKPYKCSVCSNMFGDVSHLKTHMRTHTECPSALLSEVEVEAEVLFCLIRRSIANDIACGNPILLRCLLSICSITNPLTSFCRKSLLLFTLFLFPVFII